VHAATNSAALVLQAASLAARRRGERGRGVALSLGAVSLLGAAGYLGAHLSYARGVGVDQTSFDPGPEDWTPVIEAEALGGRTPVSAVAGETPVLLVRDGATIHAIHDRCSHRGCSLAAGRLDGDVVQCACHGSRFRLADGGIERGPAASPQPAFETRERDGRIEVRVRAPH
jgi:nitrite reductase/ring-hydroxylating ferredoxin subunit